MKLPAYRADLPFTYAFGRFAVTEALTRRPEDVLEVLWHSAMPQALAAELVALAESSGVAARQDDATVARLRRKATVHCLAQVRKQSEFLNPDRDHVVLLNPSHPGNAGTAIRSLVAFGFKDLALIDPGIDPWGAYVVRASVGLRFALRCQTFGSLAEYVAVHAPVGGASQQVAGDPKAPTGAVSRSVYVFDAEGDRQLDDVEFRSPFALVFGPEWSESSVADAPDWAADIAGASLSVRIPQSNQVESLNLATSVSIAAYRARRPPRS